MTASVKLPGSWFRDALWTVWFERDFNWIESLALSASLTCSITSIVCSASFSSWNILVLRM